MCVVGWIVLLVMALSARGGGHCEGYPFVNCGFNRQAAKEASLCNGVVDGKMNSTSRLVRCGQEFLVKMSCSVQGEGWVENGTWQLLVPNYKPVS